MPLIPSESDNFPDLLGGATAGPPQREKRDIARAPSGQPEGVSKPVPGGEAPKNSETGSDTSTTTLAKSRTDKAGPVQSVKPLAGTMISQTARSAGSGVTAPPALKIDNVLSTDQLVKIYGGRAVVNGVNISARAGEIVGLLGPNGAGKTTSFYMIVGLVRPNSGRVVFSGTDVTKYPMYKRARLGMGYLPQEESIFRKLTVEQNIMAILETLSLSKHERRQRCEQLLHQFGIERIAKNQALTLSGGEKRRLTIARSLVTKPKLLMLDEPFSGVDPIAVYDVQQIIVNLRKSGLAILITDHNVRETLSIVDRAYLIFEGRVESEGTKDFLINDPISRQLYLGERFKM